MQHKGNSKKESVRVAWFMYWCLYMVVQQVMSIQSLHIWYELEK